MTFVVAREDEPFDLLYRRFKRAMEASGVLREFRRRQRFVSEAQKRKLKSKAAARRRRSRLR
jgi:small subunit ribosomal protein S21